MINKADKRKAVNEYTPPARKGGGGPKKSTMEYLNDLKKNSSEWKALVERDKAKEVDRLSLLKEAQRAEEVERLRALEELKILAAQQERERVDAELKLKMANMRAKMEAEQFVNYLMNL